MNNENEIISEEILNRINPKTKKTIKQMLIELDLYQEGEDITFAEAMSRLEPSYRLILNHADGIYRWFRFNALIKGNNDEILFYKSNGKTSTRYAIIRENRRNYYIAKEPNTIESENIIKIAKDRYSEFARITEEKL